MFVKLFYKKDEKRFSLLSNILLIASVAIMTVFMTANGGAKNLVISSVISVLVAAFFILFKKVQDKFFINISKIALVASTIFSIFLCVCLSEPFMAIYKDRIISFLNKFELSSSIVNAAPYVFLVCVIVGALPAITLCLYFGYLSIIRVFKLIFPTISRFDKYWLIGFFALFSIVLIVFYSLTIVFYGNTNAYDIVYTFDTWDLYASNCWVNVGAIENDLRQPLFGVFAIPLSIIPYAFSKILFFIPYVYAYLFGLMQIAIALLTVYLIVNLLNLEKINSLFVFCLFAVSFPFLLFIFNFEQYIFATFWLVLFIWLSSKEEVSNFSSFVVSTGSLITNAAFFPLLIEKKGIKCNILKILKAAAVFFCMIFVFGQGHIVLESIDRIKALFGFSGQGLSKIDALKQYSNFISSCFIFPQSEVVTLETVTSFQLKEVNSFNYFGIAILVASIVSFIFNRKNKMAIISIVWITVSLILLGLIGWGAKENGMILYSYYFGWAFIVLLVLLIELIPQKTKYIKFAIYSCGIVTLLVFNIYGITRIVGFGIEYYPR